MRTIGALAFLPHMDACVCWYHDHDATSCVRVANSVSMLEKHHDVIWLLATNKPRIYDAHKSRVKKFFDEHGFERPRLTGTLRKGLKKIIKQHIQYHKHLH